MAIISLSHDITLEPAHHPHHRLLPLKAFDRSHSTSHSNDSDILNNRWTLLCDVSSKVKGLERTSQAGASILNLQMIYKYVHISSWCLMLSLDPPCPYQAGRKSNLKKWGSPTPFIFANTVCLKCHRRSWSAGRRSSPPNSRCFPAIPIPSLMEANLPYSYPKWNKSLVTQWPHGKPGIHTSTHRSYARIVLPSNRPFWTELLHVPPRLQHPNRG